MLLSRDRCLLFIKGIKVAGTSVEVLLAEQLEESAIVTPISPPHPKHRPRNCEIDGKAAFFNHIGAEAIIQLIGGDEFDRMTSWGIVRNPFDKVMSLFFMRLALGMEITLQDALDECTSEATRYCDATGKSLVSHILRYEELATTLPPLLAGFGLSSSGFASIREKGSYRAAYRGEPPTLTNAQRRQIEQRFSFDLQFY